MRPWLVVIIALGAGCGFRITAGSGGDASPADDALGDASAAGDGAPTDATIADAPFATSSCPAGYTASIPSTMTSSRYRFKKTGSSPRDHAIDCANDGATTHIVSLDSLAEIQELHTAAKNSGGWATDPISHPDDTYIYVGGVQRAGQTLTDVAWVSYAGATQVVSWGQDEPNDWDFTENVEDDEEQVLALWLEGAHLADLVTRFSFGAICECDATPPSAAFAAAWVAAVGP